MNSDYKLWVEQLGDKALAADALSRLMAAGSSAMDALVNGLSHKYASVRIGCCKVLDHHLDERAIPSLIANLDHHNRKVRGWALHALGCDHCKPGECRPWEEDVLPLVIDRAGNDRSVRVRGMAVSVLGAYKDRPEVGAALDKALSDPHPKVRMIAGWSRRPPQVLA